MSTEGSGASRGGGDGIHNEDAFLVDEGLGLYVVCDGASDAPGGELAARIAVEALDQFVARADAELPAGGGRVAGPLVEKAMAYVAGALADAESIDARYGGLATTITLLLVHADVGVIGHRGDSRAYLIRRGRGQLLTVDHELAEASDAGDEATGDFDVFTVDLEPGDTFVLCTDGAEEVVQDRSIVRQASELRPRLLASRIVSAAHKKRPGSDATAVVVRVRGDREAGRFELSGEPQGTTFGHTLERAERVGRG